MHHLSRLDPINISARSPRDPPALILGDRMFAWCDQSLLLARVTCMRNRTSILRPGGCRGEDRLRKKRAPRWCKVFSFHRLKISKLYIFCWVDEAPLLWQHCSLLLWSSATSGVFNAADEGPPTTASKSLQSMLSLRCAERGVLGEEPSSMKHRRGL